MKRVPVLVLLGLVTSVLSACCGPNWRPAEQPDSGPGGVGHKHAAVTETVVGNGGSKAWVFEPDQPRPRTAPVVVLLHGWGAMRPAFYIEWIRHLVRRGNIVIYPKYQASLITLPTRMPRAAKSAIRDAIAELGKPGHVRPDETRFAVAGHSLGGIMAMNIAANAKEDGLPPPRAVMCVEPGEPRHAPRSLGRLTPIPSILGDYAGVPKGTLVLIVVGDDDIMVGDVAAKLIWKAIEHLPAKDRDYVTVVSDSHGSPTLDASHLLPLAPARGSVIRRVFGTTDALDHYGTWKLLDALTDAAFYGKNLKYALGNTPEQRYMGKWSDGTPVKELKVLNK